jgi:hypothetical protein
VAVSADPRQRAQYEALSPVQIEARLSQSITDLTHAQQTLREARDVETEAELIYKQEFYRAVLDKNAPQVHRGGYTVGERDAWVALRCRESFERYRRAQATREAAQDHLRTVRDVTEVLRSLGASVRTAYEGAGRPDR